mgnify:CR=1 FL=1
MPAGEPSEEELRQLELSGKERERRHARGPVRLSEEDPPFQRKESSVTATRSPSSRAVLCTTNDDCEDVSSPSPLRPRPSINGLR